MPKSSPLFSIPVAIFGIALSGIETIFEKNKFSIDRSELISAVIYIYKAILMFNFDILKIIPDLFVLWGRSA